MDQGLDTIQQQLPVDIPSFISLYQDQEVLWPIALLCGLSILLILLWWLAVLEYMRRAQIHSSRLHVKSRMVC